MGTAVKVTRDDLTAADLRAASSKCTDGAQVRRILAVALVLEGRPRTEAAALNGMDRQTLRDWVHRCSTDGIDGLKSRKSPGRAPFLTEARKAELSDLVIKDLILPCIRSYGGDARTCGPRWPAAGQSRCMRA